MGMWGQTVICCWDLVIQNINGDVGDDSNMLLGPSRSEYRWGCGG